MNGVFITGSNTGVGKTTVAVEIIKHLRKKRKIKARKPVETNCMKVDGEYLPKDAIALNNACKLSEQLEIVCPYRFSLEASPEEASAHEGGELSLFDLVNACNKDVDKSFVFVEGAGGIYSPIAENALNSDLASELSLPLIIVIRDELGAVSQGLLAIEAAKKNNLTIACLVLNEISSNTLSNKEALNSYTDVPILSFSLDKRKLFLLEVEGLI